METTEAANSRTVSIASAWTGVERGSCGFIVFVIRPPSSAPLKKKTNAKSDRQVDKPGAPPTAKPRNTTLPVIFAVNTWPSAIKQTASTIPLTAVIASRSEETVIISFPKAWADLAWLR